MTIDEVRAIQISDIRARLAARTPGSWIATLDNDGWCVSSVPDEGAPQQRMETLARLNCGSPRSDTADACFIASAPDDIAILLAEVERLRAEVESKTKQNVALIGQNGRLQLEVERLRGDRSEVNTAKLYDAFTEGTLAAADAGRPPIAAAFARGVQAMRMSVLAEFERWFMAKESPVYFVRSLRVLSVPEATS